MAREAPGAMDTKAGRANNFVFRTTIFVRTIIFCTYKKLFYVQENVARTIFCTVQKFEHTNNFVKKKFVRTTKLCRKDELAWVQG